MESNWDKIKPIVEEKLVELRNSDAFDPHTLALKMIDLSAWWGSVNKEIVEREYWYNILLEKKLVECDNVSSRAVIHAKATKEYKDWQEAVAYSKSVLEVLRGGRRFSKLVEAESKEAHY